MAVFGISLDRHYSAMKFMLATEQRLQSTNVMRNPFTGGVLYAGEGPGERDVYGVVMEPLYPKVWLIGLVWIAASILLGGSWGWYVPGLIMLGLGFFWSVAFMYIGLRIGIKRSGYAGRVRLVTKGELVRRLQRQNPLGKSNNFLELLKSFKRLSSSTNAPEVLADG